MTTDVDAAATAEGTPAGSPTAAGGIPAAGGQIAAAGAPAAGSTPTARDTLTAREARLLLHRAGGTPAYVYSRAALRDSVHRVRAASPAGAQLYYSLKANPHPGVVGALAHLVDGFDVCSTNELETALNAGMPPERVLFTGPAKSRAEAAAGLAAGVAVTVESPYQARLFAETAVELGVAGRAVIRLNAPYPAKAANSPSAPNHFGVPEDDLAEVAAVLRASPLSVTGLHLFWGSQYSDADVILAARERTLKRALAVAERHGLRPDFVDIGGGIAMPWLAADPPVDWAGLTAANAAEVAADAGGGSVASPVGPSAARRAVICEYGRGIVGPAGSLLTTVLDTKTIGDRHYVLVDAGMNHMLIASRLIAGGRRGEPLVSVLDPKSRTTRKTYVTGPLCSQLDVLAENVQLPPVEVGDTLVFAGVGAYGPTFSPSGFLSRDAVREIVY